MEITELNEKKMPAVLKARLKTGKEKMNQQIKQQKKT